MSSRCAVCGCDVDPTLDPARVLDDGHIATLCRRCIRETPEIDEVACAAQSDTRVFDCRCGRRIDLWRAVTMVRAGVVTVECADCAHGGATATGISAATDGTNNNELTVEAATPEPCVGDRARNSAGRRVRAVTSLRPPGRPLRTLAIVAACAVTTCLAVYVPGGAATATSTEVPANAPSSAPSDPPLTARVVTDAPAQQVVAEASANQPTEIPADDESMIDPDRWVYPLPGLDEKWQTTNLGTFGSRRPGRRPRECRRGHCGVDLHGPRGMPVVAVSTGIVDRVRRSRRGRSGRYVELLHDDGSRTYYMHLDHVRSSLREGSEVVAGEAIGTLGRTGIRTSPAHLHFSWKLDEGKRGRYKDPARMLEQSRMIPTSRVRGVEELPKRRDNTKKQRMRRRRSRS